MNTFQLHEAAQQLAESETAYNIARMYLNLKHEIKWHEHEFNIVDVVNQLWKYSAPQWAQFINHDNGNFYYTKAKTSLTVFTIEGYNECVKELSEAAWLNNGEPQYYHIHKRVVFNRLYDEALLEDLARTAYKKYRNLQKEHGLFVAPSWKRAGNLTQGVWLSMVDFNFTVNK